MGQIHLCWMHKTFLSHFKEQNTSAIKHRNVEKVWSCLRLGFCLSNWPQKLNHKKWIQHKLAVT